MRNLLPSRSVSGGLTKPEYDFVTGAEELMLAAFFNRNFKYSYHRGVKLNRKTKGATKR
jgi:hypothetical protein